MTFGTVRGEVRDRSGALVPNIWVELRHMATGYPLAVPVYAAGDGEPTADWPTGTMDNPLFSEDGTFEMHTAVGGDYRVSVYNAVYSDMWDWVQSGSAQSVDIDRYAQAGFVWAPESATTTPPSAGALRFNNADVSLASHVYIDRHTLGVSDASTWLSTMGIGDWLLLATGVGAEVGWATVSVAHVTSGGHDYYDFTVDPSSYAGPVGPVTFGDSGFVSVSQQRQASANAGTELVVTATGTTVVGATVSKVVVNLASPGSVTLTLPAVAARGGLPLVVSDFKNNADITITPSGAEVTTVTEVLPGNSVTIFPSTAISGWYAA